MRDKLTEILGIDPRCEKPNAYELFGLATGESDTDRIQAAIGATVQRLKQRQGTTDTATWKRAAMAVSKAKKLLVEPAAKSAYDAKLQARSGTGSSVSRSVAAVDTPPRKLPPRGEAAHDPLRGLLPTIDPLAPFDMDAAARRAANAPRHEPPPLPPEVELPPIVETPPMVQSLPPVETDPSRLDDDVLDFDEADAEPEFEAEGDALAVPSTPQVSRAPVRRRRRGIPVAMLVIGLLTVTMLSGVGWGIYQLVEREKNRNSPAVAQADMSDAAGTGARPNTDRPAAGPVPAVDPVMGSGPPPRRAVDSPVDDRPRRQPPRNPEVNATPNTGMSGMEMQVAGMNATVDGPPMTEPSGMEPEPMMETTPAVAPEVMQPEPMEPEPMEPGPMQPTDAEMQVGDKALQAAEAAIRNRDWKQMKPLAEMAQEVAATDQQATTARQLFELADLADYYRQGIVKALGDLKSGNTFMLTAGVEVAVVEASATELVLQVNGRPKSFPLDEMPFVLVHKLGTFTMTKEDPSVMAAKAIYQAMAPLALPQDRQQAAQWLRELPEEIEGSHPHEIAGTLERLFPAS